MLKIYPTDLISMKTTLHNKVTCMLYSTVLLHNYRNNQLLTSSKENTYSFFLKVGE